MRLFIKILLGVVAVSVALLSYFLWVMYNLSVDQANYIKTQAARAARWAEKEKPIHEQPESRPLNDLPNTPQEESKTIQVQSGLTNENQNEERN